MLARLIGNGVFIQENADDISLVVGKFPNTVSRLMQWAPLSVETWCNEVGLSVNPDKTVLVTITSKRKLPTFFEPQFFCVKLGLLRVGQVSRVILDSRLTCRKHVDVKMRKAYILLWVCRKACRASVASNPRWSTVSTSPSFGRTSLLHP